MSETNPVSPLRQRMIEDMTARKLDPHTQRSHIYSCKRFAAWLKRSPDTATAEEVRRFQLHLVESGASGIVTLAIITCQRGDPLIGRRQENQWVGDFHGGAGPLQNPLFLANVTMPA